MVNQNRYWATSVWDPDKSNLLDLGLTKNAGFQKVYNSAPSPDSGKIRVRDPETSIDVQCVNFRYGINKKS